LIAPELPRSPSGACLAAVERIHTCGLPPQAWWRGAVATVLASSTSLDATSPRTRPAAVAPRGSGDKEAERIGQRLYMIGIYALSSSTLTPMRGARMHAAPSSPGLSLARLHAARTQLGVAARVPRPLSLVARPPSRACRYDRPRGRTNKQTLNHFGVQTNTRGRHSDWGWTAELYARRTDLGSKD